MDHAQFHMEETSDLTTNNSLGVCLTFDFKMLQFWSPHHFNMKIAHISVKHYIIKFSKKSETDNMQHLNIE